MEFDIAIVGAGPVGLSFAQSLAGSNLRVAIVERQSEAALAEPVCDGREIALTHASRRILRELGIWPRIPAGEISPLRDAEVFDGASEFRLRIGHRDGGKPELGFLVPNHRIREAAFEAVRDSGAATLLASAKVISVGSDAQAARAQLADGREIRCALLVAADTRFSETRRAMGIAASMHDFGRTMLVCRMAHDVPHRQVAWEWFDRGQTLAVLPLAGDASSIVVTVPARESEALLALPDDAFGREMTRRFGGRLGAMTLVGSRHAYPLVAVYPERFVGRRFALIGDAAVGMHPVTAHGFNFGLGGVERLSRGILDAHRCGRDVGTADLLAAYERAHRRATRPLYLATNGIARLYTDDSAPARLVREGAIRFAQRLAPLRRRIAGALADPNG